MKSALAHYTGREEIVRPPLMPLGQSVQVDLLKKLTSLKFEMPIEQ